MLPRPRREYTPHATPAAAISAAPAGAGAVSPGNTSTTRPDTASPRPTHSAVTGRSPARSPATIMVSWTAPKRMRAPVPAPRLTYAKLNAAA